jgi:hypothetical protein
MTKIPVPDLSDDEILKRAKMMRAVFYFMAIFVPAVMLTAVYHLEDPGVDWIDFYTRGLNQLFTDAPGDDQFAGVIAIAAILIFIFDIVMAKLSIKKISAKLSDAGTDQDG